MRTAVSGDRNHTDQALVDDTLDEELQADPEMFLLVGDCPGKRQSDGSWADGVDRMAHAWAHRRGVPHEVFKADWQGLGKRAGPERNGQMLDAGAERLVAIHLNLADSKGTARCIRQAEERHLPVRLVPDPKPEMVEFYLAEGVIHQVPAGRAEEFQQMVARAAPFAGQLPDDPDLAFALGTLTAGGLQPQVLSGPYPNGQWDVWHAGRHRYPTDDQEAG